MVDAGKGIYGLLVEMTAKTAVSFPNFPGIALRGSLGHCMKKSVCVARRGAAECRTCALAESCVYARAFESVARPGGEAMPKASNYPHPFALTPLFNAENVINPGDIFRARLSLFGSGIAHLPYFIHALARLGEAGIGRSRAKFLLSGIVNLADGKRVFDIDAGFTRDSLSPIAVEGPVHIPRLCVDFITPCRLTREHRETRDTAFPSLFRGVYRRLALLSTLYGFGLPGGDREELLHAAEEVMTVGCDLTWECNERYSRRQGNSMVLRGFTGRAVYVGNLAPFYSFMKMAEAVNIGKNTSFGYGAVGVSINDGTDAETESRETGAELAGAGRRD